MTLRNPIVLIAGQLQELPAGDTINGATGGAGNPDVAKFFVIGALSVTTGTVRWYPERTISISSVYFSLGVAPTSSVVVDVKKNGTSIFGGSKPTCSSGQNKSTVISLSMSVATTDYLTVDVVSADGSNATVCVVYS